MSNTITAERLREVLDYNPETGIFVWRFRPNVSARAGKIAGCVSINGYIKVNSGSKTYFAHRLAWLYVHGVWPKEYIDHINGDKADNRIDNLREATPAQNCQNLRRATSACLSGILGVSKREYGYSAHITIGYKTRNLGKYATIEEAQAAYLAAKTALHEFSTLPSVNRVPEQRPNIVKAPGESGVKGIQRTSSGKWIVRLPKDGRHVSVGTFSCLEAAIQRRDFVLSYPKALEDHGHRRIRSGSRNTAPNASRAKGVTLRSSGRYRANIIRGQRALWSATFDTIEEAAQARDAALARLKLNSR